METCEQKTSLEAEMNLIRAVSLKLRTFFIKENINMFIMGREGQKSGSPLRWNSKEKKSVRFMSKPNYSNRTALTLTTFLNCLTSSIEQTLITFIYFLPGTR